jgi:hypothetical protein
VTPSAEQQAVAGREEGAASAARLGARTAYAAAGLNLLAAVAILLVLRPGLPAPGSLAEERLAFVQGHTGRWWAGWLAWHAAALALLAFYLALAARWGRRAPLRCRLAVLCAAAGLAVDLGAQGLTMGLAPRLSVQEFAVLEAAAGLATGYTGNGLYTTAGILLTWAGAGELPRPLLALAGLVWTAGVGLSVTSLVGSAAGQIASTAALMSSFVLWSFLTGRWLSRRAS